jgi:hypothetical protein
MPVYMDRHYVQGATRAAVADAHELDLAVQEKYKLQFLTALHSLLPDRVS